MPGIKFNNNASSGKRLVLSLEQNRVEAVDESKKYVLASDKSLSDVFFNQLNERLKEHTYKLDDFELAIEIDRDAALTRHITLPANTQGNLYEVIKYEMDRYTPFQAEDVYFDYIIEDKIETKDLIKIKLIVVKKEILQPVFNFIQKEIINLKNIDIIDRNNPENSFRNVNLFRTHKSQRIRNNSVRNLKWLTVVLLVLTAITPLIINYIHIHQLKNELETLQPKIDEVKILQAEYQEMLSHVGYLVEKKERHPSIIKVLNVLTQATPDHTFVQRLTLENGLLTIQGLSQSAAELIPIIDDTGLFENIRFAAPVTQSASNNLERYSITAKLVSFKDIESEEF